MIDRAGMLLVAGCPRSGTHYTAALLQHLGLRVAHEAVREDGTVSWVHITSGTYVVPERNRSKEVSNEGFDRILHQVRHPLKVISSMQTLRKCSWDYMARHISLDTRAPVPVRAMKAWVEWNKLIEKKASWRFQIERIKDVFPEFLNQAGIQPVAYPVLPHEARESRTHRYNPLDWGHLIYSEPSLAREVAAMASRYGYEVPDMGAVQPVEPVIMKLPLLKRIRLFLRGRER
jgi:hypothetical protein